MILINIKTYKKESTALFLKNKTPIFKYFKDSLLKCVQSKPKLSDEPFRFQTDKFKIILKDSFGQVYCKLINEKLKGNFSNNLNKLNQKKQKTI